MLLDRLINLSLSSSSSPSASCMTLYQPSTHTPTHTSSPSSSHSHTNTPDITPSSPTLQRYLINQLLHNTKSFPHLLYISLGTLDIHQYFTSLATTETLKEKLHVLDICHCHQHHHQSSSSSGSTNTTTSNYPFHHQCVSKKTLDSLDTFQHTIDTYISTLLSSSHHNTYNTDHIISQASSTTTSASALIDTLDDGDVGLNAFQSTNSTSHNTATNSTYILPIIIDNISTLLLRGHTIESIVLFTESLKSLHHRHHHSKHVNILLITTFYESMIPSSPTYTCTHIHEKHRYKSLLQHVSNTFVHCYAAQPILHTHINTPATTSVAAPSSISSVANGLDRMSVNDTDSSNDKKTSQLQPKGSVTSSSAYRLTGIELYYDVIHTKQNSMHGNVLVAAEYVRITIPQHDGTDIDSDTHAHRRDMLMKATVIDRVKQSNDMSGDKSSHPKKVKDKDRRRTVGTMNMKMTERQREARDKLILPYMHHTHGDGTLHPTMSHVDSAAVMASSSGLFTINRVKHQTIEQHDRSDPDEALDETSEEEEDDDDSDADDDLQI